MGDGRGAGRYTGVAAPGGPAAVRVLDDVVLRKLSVGPMDNAAYVLACRRSGARLLVDAAAEPDRLLDLARAGVPGDPDGDLALVVTTHRHRDHLGALAAVLDATGAPHAAGADDAEAVAADAGTPPPRPLAHGDVVEVGALRLEVVALRGHTPGAVALAYREPGDASAPGAVPGRVHLLTGDSLFPGGPGRTTTPAAFASLMADLEDRVFGRFGDDTWVYPGHGRDTTLGAERPHLDEWRARGW
ncbi:MBL fold metallo-hydrolase [Cellulomonas pakistanensis]|uniref:MBL fold metallo-hydrolase n=1 Tax=Cellulomonas pakistanensis TaxID=992287 RepID=UPI001EF399D8|nr:MBL fold metallo-hydrolase [Cellulomonas pakistanensis]